MLPQWLKKLNIFDLDLDKIKILQFKYSSALDILDTHLQLRIDNYQRNNDTKIVEHYSKRLKKGKSVLKKLEDKKCKFSAENIEEIVKDVVGIRIVCPFIDDVYKIRDLIRSSDFIDIYQEKDYIKEPKKTGYQSLHLLVKVPVRIDNRIEKIKAEIQVRNVAMDAWAAVEHRIKYKPIGSKKNVITDEDKNTLINCSRALKGLEERMSDLFNPEYNQKYKIENNDNVNQAIFNTHELKKNDFEYNAALKILKTHLHESIKYFELVNGTKKVEHYDERIKTLDSTLRKLKEKGCDLTIDSLQENVRDYAGVRLVCPFIDDVYDIVDLIKSSDLLEVYQIKDYIKHPKESGYQSVHLLVNVPVVVGDNIKKIKAEIQVRTLSMDAWAAIEERIKYLVQNNNLTSKQLEALQIFARSFQEIDEFYNKLNRKMKNDSKEKDLKVKKIEKK